MTAPLNSGQARMELSPGVELVWWLASREALHAKAPAVEPEHFFCALLAFADMSDSELQTVARFDLAQEKLVELRDKLRWHLRLRELDTRTAELRHAVRRAVRRDRDTAAAATLHRSEAARRIFDTASALARQSHEKLSPQHLLYALLETQPPAIAQAISGSAAAPAEPPEPAGPETPELPETLVARAATPALDQYTRSVPPAMEPDAAGAESLRAALADDTPSPRLLICLPDTPLWPLLAGAAPSVPPPGRVVAVIMADLSRETWLALLAEARRTATRLFVDLTQQRPALVEKVVETLATVVKDANGVFVAVEADHYRQFIQLVPERANAFNPLWLM